MCSCSMNSGLHVFLIRLLFFFFFLMIRNVNISSIKIKYCKLHVCTPYRMNDPFSKTVTDPSEWEDTKLSSLKELDSLQRCYICKEFLKAPVITSCNHTFCSYCIREYLISNNKCPLCKSEQLESNLKRVILLEEIVFCFSKLRPKLMGLLEGKSSKNHPIQSKKKDDKIQSEERSVNSLPSKREVIEVSSSESDENNKGEILHKSVKKTKIESPNESTSAIPNRKDNVACPICSGTMTAEYLQTRHIDMCLNGKTTPSPPRSVLQSFLGSQKKNSKPATNISSFFKRAEPHRSIENHHTDDNPVPHMLKFYFDEASKHHHNNVKRLPMLNFNSLTTTKLKEKLVSLGLPAQGNRTQLELRYNQYYILFNSNLDSNRPLSEKVLRKKLSEWEFSHLAFSGSTSSSLFNRGTGLSNKNISDRNFPLKKWLRTYKNDYRELISRAKAATRQPAQTDELNSDITTNTITTEKSAKPESTSSVMDSLDFSADLSNSPLFSDPVDGQCEHRTQEK